MWFSAWMPPGRWRRSSTRCGKTWTDSSTRSPICQRWKPEASQPPSADWCATSQLTGISTVSLAERGTWEIPLTFPTEVLDISTGVDGKLYSGLPPGASILALPLYPAASIRAAKDPVPLADREPFVFDNKLLQLNGWDIPDNWNFVSTDKIYWLQILGVIVVTGFCGASTAVLVFHSLARFNLTDSQRFRIALLGAFATPLFCHSTVYSKEAIAACLGFGAFVLTRHTLGGKGESTGSKNAIFGVLAGLLSGLSVTINYPSLLLSLLLACMLLIGRAWSRFLPFIVGAFLPLAALMAYQAKLFGGILISPYSNRLGEELLHHHSGFLGFNQINFQALWGLTFSPFSGVFIYVLFLIPALAVCFASSRLRRSLAVWLSAAFIFGLLLTFSFTEKSVVWSGALVGYGPRHLVIATPFMVLLFGAAISETANLWARCALWATLGGSLFIQILSVSYGGLRYPDVTARTKVLLSDDSVLATNPVREMLRAAFETGISPPIFRARARSDE